MEITDANSFIKADTSYVCVMDTTSNFTFTEETSPVDNSNDNNTNNNKGNETAVNFNETRMNATRIDCNETKFKFSSNETVMSKTIIDDSMDMTTSNQTIDISRNQIFHETIVCFNNQTLLNSEMVEKNDKTMLNETSAAFTFDKTLNQIRCQNETVFVSNSLNHTTYNGNNTTINFNCVNQTKINETTFAFNSVNQTKVNETVANFNCQDQTLTQDQTKSFNHSKLLDTTSNLSLVDKIKQNATFHLTNGNQSIRLDASTNQSFSRADVEFKSTDEQDLNLLNKMRSDKIFIMDTLEQMRKTLKECKEKKAQEKGN